jgi:hypothetical protein
MCMSVDVRCTGTPRAGSLPPISETQIFREEVSVLWKISMIENDSPIVLERSRCSLMDLWIPDNAHHVLMQSYVPLRL